LRRANWLERLLFRHRFPVLKPGERAPTQQDASLAAPSDQPKEPSNIPAERGQS